MSLLYSAFRSNLKTNDGEKLWYPRLFKVGNTMGTLEIGQEVAKRSSMSPGDVLNVIETMQDIIQQNLLNSRSVRLDRIGTFTVTCRSAGNGVSTEEDVTSKQISNLKIRFTPSFTRSAYNGTTRAMFEGVTFEKVNKVKKGTKSEDEQGGTNPVGGNDDDDFVDPGA